VNIELETIWEENGHDLIKILLWYLHGGLGKSMEAYSEDSWCPKEDLN
jgi:hypothetical protein